MNTWHERVAEMVEATSDLITKLTASAPDWATEGQINEALVFVGVQCDVDEDDYETLEATFLARIADTDKRGER